MIEESESDVEQQPPSPTPGTPPEVRAARGEYIGNKASTLERSERKRTQIESKRSMSVSKLANLRASRQREEQ